MTKQKEYMSKCCSYLYKEKQSRGSDPVNVLTWVCSKCNKECELVENVDIDHKKTVHATDKGVYVNGVKQDPLLEDWRGKLFDLCNPKEFENTVHQGFCTYSEMLPFITQLLEEKEREIQHERVMVWMERIMAIDTEVSLAGNMSEKMKLVRAFCIARRDAEIRKLSNFNNPNNEKTE